MKKVGRRGHINATILNRMISDSFTENETLKIGTFYFHVNNKNKISVEIVQIYPNYKGMESC